MTDFADHIDVMLLARERWRTACDVHGDDSPEAFECWCYYKQVQLELNEAFNDRG